MRENQNQGVRVHPFLFYPPPSIICKPDEYRRIANTVDMKKRTTPIVYVLLLLLLTASCRHSLPQEGNEEIYAALRKSEALLNVFPDSALSILDAISRDNAGRLTDWEQWAVYIQRCVLSRYHLNFDAAEAYCLRALKLAEKMNDTLSIATAITHFSVVEASRGNQRNSINYVRRAIALLDDENQELITQLHLNIAAAYIQVGVVDSALYYIQLAIVDAKRTNDLRAQAFVSVHVAALYFQLGNYQQAEAYYREAIPLFEQQEDMPNLMTTYANISTALFRQNRTAESLQYAQKADDIATSIGVPSITLRNIYAQKGQQLFDAGDYRSSLNMFYRALENSIFRQNPRLMAIDYNHVGRTQLRLGNYDWARYYIDKAIETVSQNDDSRLRLRILRSLVSLYVLRGDIYQFEATMDIKGEIRDSLLYSSHIIALQQLEMRYIAERNELLLAQQAIDIQHTRNRNVFLSIILSLVIVLFAITTLFHRHRMKEMVVNVRHYEELLKYKKDVQIQRDSPRRNVPMSKLATDLHHLFEVDRIYRQQGLTVDDVVAMLKTNSKYLSNAIKEISQKSFVEYVNTYRVEEAIEMFKEQKEGGKFAHYSTEMIAEAVGFNNRVSFYSAFKRIVGVAPKEYMEILELQNEEKDTEAT